MKGHNSVWKIPKFSKFSSWNALDKQWPERIKKIKQNNEKSAQKLMTTPLMLEPNFLLKPDFLLKNSSIT